jgi:succinate dehydrogenase/fumarate reductase flavoprotein subunit
MRLAVEDLEGKGITVEYETPGTRLLQLPDGTVIGVVAEKDGKEINIKATTGVILATGGYEFDYLAIRNSYTGWPTFSRGAPYNTGDGLKMAQKAGAALWHMNSANAGGMAILAPGLNFGHGVYNSDYVSVNGSAPTGSYIWVDQYGKRFMNERRTDSHGYGKREYVYWFDGLEVEWPRLPYWTIFDDAAAKARAVGAGASATSSFSWFTMRSGYTWSADNQAEVAKGWILKDDTIEGLAAKISAANTKIDSDWKRRNGKDSIKCDPAVLKASVDKYNAASAAGVDTEFGRTPLAALGAGPYYAYAAYPTQYNTQGGPKRNSKAQTLDPFGKPIPHLYTVGELGAGYAWVYNGGFNIAECIATGIWSGTDVVTNEAWDAIK